MLQFVNQNILTVLITVHNIHYKKYIIKTIGLQRITELYKKKKLY